MELEKLLLTKQELPILNETCFQIPIHPKLLDPNLEIDESLARKIFPEVAEEWYEDLKEYNPEDRERKEWINRVFLKEKPVVKKHYNHQILNGFWEDDVNFLENGLVQCFSISRNAGGSIYFNENEFNCQSFGNIYIKFSEDKKKEFEFEKGKIYAYGSHNIDHYPGALFLRNWAIKYMNEVFKQRFI
jgi:hypothetical protein